LDAAMSLFKRQEQMCRQQSNWEGLARSLANQAKLLAERKGDPQTARLLAETSLRLATQNGLRALAQQFEKIMTKINGLLK
jgi:hypothetical protein